MVFEHNVKVVMRDGVVLRADVYRPAADGKFPVLLQRTPYDGAICDLRVEGRAARGYVVIIQDVRGRYTSEGEWYTFVNEPNDGYDTVEWAAALPYSNGKVGMFGGSYVGATQMLAAIAHPPHLAGICPVVTSQQLSRWLDVSGRRVRTMVQRVVDVGAGAGHVEPRSSKDTNAVEGMWKLPLNKYPLLIPDAAAGASSASQLAPYFIDWLAHPSYDDYWKPIAIEEHFADINVPALT